MSEDSVQRSAPEALSPEKDLPTRTQGWLDSLGNKVWQVPLESMIHAIIQEGNVTTTPFTTPEDPWTRWSHLQRTLQLSLMLGSDHHEC